MHVKRAFSSILIQSIYLFIYLMALQQFSITLLLQVPLSSALPPQSTSPPLHADKGRLPIDISKTRHLKVAIRLSTS